MESFLVSVNAVLPIFIMFILGYFLRQIKMINDDLIFQINKLVFKLFLPVMLFNNIFNSDLKSSFNPSFILFGMASVIAIFILSVVFTTTIRKDNKRRGAMIQALFRSNYIILGLPVINAIFSEEYSSVPALLAAFVVPLFNLLAVVALEIFRGSKPKFTQVLKSIITNPLIIAATLGLILNISGIRFPAVISSTITTIGSVATPLPLITLGAFIRFDSLKKNRKDLAICTVGRLILIPLIFSSIAVLIGFRGAEFASLLIMFAAPPAVASFTMAQQMDSDYALTGETIIVTSSLSCLTIFMWIFVYSLMGII